MTDKSVEKSFLYLILLSVLLHAAIFALVIYLPQEKKPVSPEPYMVELRDLPEPPKISPEKKQKEVKRFAEQKRRVEKEIAPKGERERDRVASLPPVRRPVPMQPQMRPTPPQSPAPERRPEPGDYPIRRQAPPKRMPSPGEAPSARREKVPDLARLMPGADKMAKLEETYRKKYGPEVEEGETRFLNTEDILFGSFLRRFETAVYGVWRYPSDAVRMGIEGTTPVRITFNKAGQVMNVEILESSGSRILDDEVMRTLRQIGPVGALPKGYPKETFKLVAFFQYGLVSGSRRLH